MRLQSKLLTPGKSVTKLAHGDLVTYRPSILYLMPADSAGMGRNLCINASPQCAALCLVTSGRMGMSNATRARMNRTRYMLQDPQRFRDRLDLEVSREIGNALKARKVPCFRLDGTSDIGLGINFARRYPMARWYDYTKDFGRMRLYLAGRMPRNYHLTFSRSELNHEQALLILQAGGNVAVPFDTPRGRALPTTWEGFAVIDGDVTDFRFGDPQGVVVGLRAKGKARKATAGGFIQKAQG